MIEITVSDDKGIIGRQIMPRGFLGSKQWAVNIPISGESGKFVTVEGRVIESSTTLTDMTGEEALRKKKGLPPKKPARDNTERNAIK